MRHAPASEEASFPGPSCEEGLISASTVYTATSDHAYRVFASPRMLCLVLELHPTLREASVLITASIKAALEFGARGPRALVETSVSVRAGPAVCTAGLVAPAVPAVLLVVTEHIPAARRRARRAARPGLVLVCAARCFYRATIVTTTSCPIQKQDGAEDQGVRQAAHHRPRGAGGDVFVGDELTRAWHRPTPNAVHYTRRWFLKPRPSRDPERIAQTLYGGIGSMRTCLSLAHVDELATPVVPASQPGEEQDTARRRVAGNMRVARIAST